MNAIVWTVSLVALLSQCFTANKQLPLTTFGGKLMARVEVCRQTEGQGGKLSLIY